MRGWFLRIILVLNTFVKISWWLLVTGGSGRVRAHFPGFGRCVRHGAWRSCRQVFMAWVLVWMKDVQRPKGNRHSTYRKSSFFHTESKAHGNFLGPTTKFSPFQVEPKRRRHGRWKVVEFTKLPSGDDFGECGKYLSIKPKTYPVATKSRNSLTRLYSLDPMIFCFYVSISLAEALGSWC